MAVAYFALTDPDPEKAGGVLRVTRDKGLSTDVYRPGKVWAFTGAGMQYLTGDLESWPITTVQAKRIMARIDALPVQKYNEDQPRDDHGRFGETGSGGADVASAVEADAQGGFVVHPDRGTTPETGYQVAITGHTTKLDASVLTDHAALATALRTFVQDNHGVMPAGGKMYIGGWTHEGTLYLEPSERVSSRAAAVQAGNDRGQYSIWDNAAQKEIVLGGTAGLA